MDVHEDVHKSTTISAIHANAELFNPHTEYVGHDDDDVMHASV